MTVSPKSKIGGFLLLVPVLMLLTAWTGYAEARLLLGTIRTDEAGLSSAQVEQLGSRLGAALEEPIGIRAFPDVATLIQWMDAFAMLDLALIPTSSVADYAGRFLSLGPVDAEGRWWLVARQGITGNLPEKLAPVLKQSSSTRGATAETSIVQPPSEVESKPTPPPAQRSVVAPLPARPQAEPARDRQAARESAPTPKAGSPAAARPERALKLGVLSEAANLLQTTSQTQSLAAALSAQTGLDVQVRVFAEEDDFYAWLQRYRMLDLVVLPPELANRARLSSYYPVVEMVGAAEGRAAEGAMRDILFRRDDLAKDVVTAIREAMLTLAEAPAGQSLRAETGVASITLPDRSSARPLPPPPPGEPERPAGEADFTAPPAPLPPPPGPELVLRPPRIKPGPEPPVPPAAAPLTRTAEVGPLSRRVLPGPPEAPLHLTARPERPSLPEFASPAVPSVVQEPAGGLTGGPENLAMPGQPPAEPGLPELPALATRVSPPLPADPGPAMPEMPEVTAAIPSSPSALVTIPSPPIPAPEGAPPEKLPVAPEVPELPRIAGPDTLTQDLAVPAVPDQQPRPGSVTVPQPPLPSAAPVPGPPSIQEVPVPPATQPPTVGQVPAARQETSLPLPPEPDIQEEEVADLPAPLPAASRNTGSSPVDDAALSLLLPRDRRVPDVIAQPKLPQALRPPGVPVPRPGRTARSTEEDQLLVASLPEPRQATKPPKPKALLPDPVADPGVVYIVPFQSVMVPRQVESRLFDQFIEALNAENTESDFSFVILKEGLQEVDPAWLASRNYVTGEIYAYVEESGCCSTDLRTKARLVYHRPNQQAPAFAFNYPAQNFFDHDRSTLDAERRKLADEVSQVLAGELLKALTP